MERRINILHEGTIKLFLILRELQENEKPCEDFFYVEAPLVNTDGKVLLREVKGKLEEVVGMKFRNRINKNYDEAILER